MVNIYRYNYN